MKSIFRNAFLTATCATWVALCGAAPSEKYEDIRLSNPDWKYVVEGVFSKTAKFFPNDTIFFIAMSHANQDSAYQSMSIQFAGRTGEKSFELTQTEVQLGQPLEPKKIPVYFEPGSLLPFQIPMILPGCEKKLFGVSLRMMKLEGNSLEVQTVLPECSPKPSN